MNYRIIPIVKKEDIPEEYRDTPIGLFLEYHNLDRPFDIYSEAQLLIGMCMDNRKHLHIPENFAYIIRSGGANMRYSEFKISYSIAVGQVSHIVLIAHNNCGMVNLVSRKEDFINGLITRAGWTREMAQEHFMNFAPLYEIDNEIGFIIGEKHRLSQKYPKIKIAAMYYRIEENQLYCIEEN
ncbi:MAG: carbonic anhydrase [Candidatus Omnitrophota bacterium]